ncbi:MAG: PspA/IM30 family protein [Candidatus Zipacnadales bacterium]
MWTRIKAVFRSLFGWMLRGAENPELLLRQHIDELRERVPEMNRQVAEVVKLEKMLDMQVDRLGKKIAFLEPRVVQAVKLGPAKKEAAKTLIAALEQARADLEETKVQLEQARENSERTKRMRAAYERRIRDQIQECMRQISRVKRAEMEERIAEVMGAFEIGDTTETVERLRERIDERLARAQARMEVAAQSTDAQLADIELAEIEDESERLYQEYQRQLGLLPPEPTERTMETVEASTVEEKAEPQVEEQTQ